MLQVIFGDDEHTAADGPYVRVLKTRKWLYLLSVGSFAVSFGLYDPVATKELVHVVTLPARTLAGSAALGLCYLGFQYALLVGQLWTTYDIILDERLTFRRADELATANEQESAARDALKSVVAEPSSPEMLNIKSQLSTLKQRRKDLDTQVKVRLQQSGSFTDVARLTTSTDLNAADLSEIKSVEGKAAHLRRKLSELAQNFDPLTDPSFAFAKEKLELMIENRERLMSQVPSSRMGYTAMERAIDISRIGPPIFLAAYALYELVSRILLV